MKRLLWFSRGERPIVELILSAEAIDWLLNYIPRDDEAHDDLRKAMVEATADTSTERS